MEAWNTAQVTSEGLEVDPRPHSTFILVLLITRLWPGYVKKKEGTWKKRRTQAGRERTGVTHRSLCADPQHMSNLPLDL